MRSSYMGEPAFQRRAGAKKRVLHQECRRAKKGSVRFETRWHRRLILPIPEILIHGRGNMSKKKKRFMRCTGCKVPEVVQLQERICLGGLQRSTSTLLMPQRVDLGHVIGQEPEIRLGGALLLGPALWPVNLDGHTGRNLDCWPLCQTSAMAPMLGDRRLGLSSWLVSRPLWACLRPHWLNSMRRVGQGSSVPQPVAVHHGRSMRQEEEMLARGNKGGAGR